MAECERSLTAIDWLTQLKVQRIESGLQDDSGESLCIKASDSITPCKPTQSYFTLITNAIENSAQKQCTLNDIYKYIMETYPFYQTASIGWKNSIRHNLSMNEVFRKVARAKEDPGKGSYWQIVTPDTVDSNAIAENGGLNGEFKHHRISSRRRRSLKYGRKSRLSCESLKPYGDQTNGSGIPVNLPATSSHNICTSDATASVQQQEFPLPCEEDALSDDIDLTASMQSYIYQKLCMPEIEQKNDHFCFDGEYLFPEKTANLLQHSTSSTSSSTCTDMNSYRMPTALSMSSLGGASDMSLSLSSVALATPNNSSGGDLNFSFSGLFVDENGGLSTTVSSDDGGNDSNGQSFITRTGSSMTFEAAAAAFAPLNTKKNDSNNFEEEEEEEDYFDWTSIL